MAFFNKLPAHADIGLGYFPSAAHVRLDAQRYHRHTQQMMSACNKTGTDTATPSQRN